MTRIREEEDSVGARAHQRQLCGTIFRLTRGTLTIVGCSSMLVSRHGFLSKRTRNRDLRERGTI